VKCHTCNVSWVPPDGSHTVTCWVCGGRPATVGAFDPQMNTAWHHNMRVDVVAPAYIGSFDLRVEPVAGYPF